MFRNLKLYYIIVSLPFVLLLLGSAVFYDRIALTISKNPHPQINYAIFGIILVGGILVILHAHKLIREARTLVDYSSAVRAKTDWVTLQERTNTYTGDISYLLQMVASSGGRSISHQEQAALEHEHTAARNHLIRRNALPQYLTGLLVGMGLLGTFVGLLATLNDISILISSFAELDMNNVNPIQVFRIMIERMKAPMQSMGIAFSASMFGLLGSIILGLMMLGIRRIQGDIFSVLGSEVARHIELALSHESVTIKNGEAVSGDDSKILIRIEERLAEASRLQQRTLTSEIDFFQKQRSDMLRILTEQAEASQQLRSEIQQLGRQLGSILTVMEKTNGGVNEQISELTVQLAGNARESQKLLVSQVDEQKKLRDTLDSYRIEERLAEAARVQQRGLTAEIEDFQKQRADMLQALAAQTEANNNFRKDLQGFGRELGSMNSVMEKGHSDLCSQLSELMIHLTADAKETHKLLAIQVNEQKRLRESLDSSVKQG